MTAGQIADMESNINDARLWVSAKINEYGVRRLARALGFSAMYISEIKTGKRNLKTTEALVRMCKIILECEDEGRLNK